MVSECSFTQLRVHVGFVKRDVLLTTSALIHISNF